MMSLLEEDTGKIPVHELASLLTDEPALDDTVIGSADQLRELLARATPVEAEPVPSATAADPLGPLDPLEPPASALRAGEHGDPPALHSAVTSAPGTGFRHLPRTIPGGLSWSVWLVFGILLGGVSCGIGRLLLP